jgi:hypothetical protein
MARWQLPATVATLSVVDVLEFLDRCHGGPGHPLIGEQAAV